MQALCGLQGIFDLFNCKTPVSKRFFYVMTCKYHVCPPLYCKCQVLYGKLYRYIIAEQK